MKTITANKIVAPKSLMLNAHPTLKPPQSLAVSAMPVIQRSKIATKPRRANLSIVFLAISVGGARFLMCGGQHTICNAQASCQKYSGKMEEL